MGIGVQPCCCPGCEVWVDDFGDGTITGYTQDAGSWSESGGKITVSSDYAALKVDAAGPDEVMRVIATVEGNDGAVARLCLGYTDEDNYVYVECRMSDGTTSPYVRVGSRVAGVDSTLATRGDLDAFYFDGVDILGGVLAIHYRDGVLSGRFGAYWICTTDAAGEPANGTTALATGNAAFAQTVSFFDLDVGKGTASCPGMGCVEWLDDFDRASLGGRYTVNAGTWAIVTDELHTSSASATITVDPGHLNSSSVCGIDGVDFEFDIWCDDDGGIVTLDVGTLELRITFGTSGEYVLDDGGTEHTCSLAVPTSTWMHVRLEMESVNGGQVRLTVDGAVAIDIYMPDADAAFGSAFSFSTDASFSGTLKLDNLQTSIHGEHPCQTETECCWPPALPDQLRVTVANLANQDCSDCNDLNGEYILSKVATVDSECARYTGSAPAVCDVTGVTLVVSNPTTTGGCRLQFRFDGSGGTQPFTNTSVCSDGLSDVTPCDTDSVLLRGPNDSESISDACEASTGECATALVEII